MAVLEFLSGTDLLKFLFISTSSWRSLSAHARLHASRHSWNALSMSRSARLAWKARDLQSLDLLLDTWRRQHLTVCKKATSERRRLEIRLIRFDWDWRDLVLLKNLLGGMHRYKLVDLDQDQRRTSLSLLPAALHLLLCIMAASEF